jgi:hypothetical protein
MLHVGRANTRQRKSKHVLLHQLSTAQLLQTCQLQQPAFNVSAHTPQQHPSSKPPPSWQLTNDEHMQSGVILQATHRPAAQPERKPGCIMVYDIPGITLKHTQRLVRAS